MEQITVYIAYVGMLSVLLPILLYLFKKKKNELLTRLTIFLLVGFLFDIMGLVQALLYRNNLQLINFYSLFEFSLGSFIFYTLKVLPKRLFITANILFVILFIITSAFLQPLTSNQTVTTLSTSIFFIYCCVQFYIKLLKTLPVDNPWYYPPFLLCVLLFVSIIRKGFFHLRLISLLTKIFHQSINIIFGYSIVFLPSYSM
jgi:hypothetical protein